MRFVKKKCNKRVVFAYLFIFNKVFWQLMVKYNVVYELLSVWTNFVTTFFICLFFSLLELCQLTWFSISDCSHLQCDWAYEKAVLWTRTEFEVLSFNYFNSFSWFLLCMMCQFILQAFQFFCWGIYWLWFTDHRRDDPEVIELLTAIEKAKEEFESIERPTLEIENPKEKQIPTAKAIPSEDSQNSHSHDPQSTSSPKSTVIAGSPKSTRASTELDPDSELARLELEFGKVNKDYSSEEISGWEFDELEKELRSEAYNNPWSCDIHTKN